MEIRKAKIDDLTSITNLLIEEFSKPPYNEANDFKAAYDSLLYYFNLGGGLLAYDGEQLVGILIYRFEQYWKGPAGIIQEFMVCDTYQGKGTGSLILKEFEKLAQEQSAYVIGLLTHKNAPAVEFYKKRGYKVSENTISMSKKI